MSGKQEMERHRSNAGRLLVEAVIGKLEGCAVLATHDGRVIEANRNGWAAVLGILRQEGRAAGAPTWRAFLNRGRRAPQGAEAEFTLSQGRRYRLRATPLPLAGRDGHPLLCVLGDEVAGRTDEPLARLRRRLRLSAEESDVLRLSLEGHSNLRIARELELHPQRVKAHRKRLELKLGAKKSSQPGAWFPVLRAG